MNPLVLIGVMVLLPAGLILVTKTKAALVFMALCVGFVLSSFVGDVSLDLVQTLVRGYSPTTQSTVQLGLLLAPVVLSLLFLMRSAKGPWLLNLVPALLTGLMTLFFVTPLLPDGTMYSITGTQVWDQLSQYQPMLISAAVVISLAQLWTSSHVPKDMGKKKHKK